VTMGTRFCASREAPIHDNVKQAYIDKDERETDILFRPFRNSARVGRNAISTEVLRRTSQPNAVFAEVAELVSGQRGKALLQSGEIDSGVYWASMAQGLIHDIPSCGDLIDRMVVDARAIVAERLAAMVSD